MAVSILHCRILICRAHSASGEEQVCEEVIGENQIKRRGWLVVVGIRFAFRRRQGYVGQVGVWRPIHGSAPAGAFTAIAVIPGERMVIGKRGLPRGITNHKSPVTAHHRLLLVPVKH
jgi:hypothetical protein